MSFRLRQTLVTSLAVAAAIAVASALVYVLIRNELRSQVDDQLEQAVAVITRGPVHVEDDPSTDGLRLDLGRGGLGLSGVVVQAVRSDGTVIQQDSRLVELPVSDDTIAAASGERERFFSDATVADVHVRMLTVPANDGYALQLVRSIDDIDRLLHRIGLIMIFLALGGIGVAALLGALVARAALKPVRRLTREAEVVAETQDLAHRIDVHGRDELARLGSSFNTMLAALEVSHQAQRQLVADASHELRTPLTSLRTNIEVLARNPALNDEKRTALLGDVVGQLEEMSSLVTDLVEVAADRPPDLEAIEVQLDELVQDAVDRARRLAPHVEISLEAEPTVVRGVPARLDRAVANLLDNAVKWSPAGGTIEVAVDGGEVRVRDHGPGIDEVDLPHVFDRFYRSAAARQMPGSGLGLAIVKQVADEHGGTIALERAEGGGTRARLRLHALAEPAPAA